MHGGPGRTAAGTAWALEAVAGLGRSCGCGARRWVHCGDAAAGRESGVQRDGETGESDGRSVGGRGDLLITVRGLTLKEGRQL